MSKFQALLCDDVRVEDNGKFIAIGAYTEMFGVNSFPVENELSLLLVVSEIEPGENILKLSIHLEGEYVEGTEKSFPFEASEHGRATLRFYAIGISASEPSLIEICCATEHEDLRKIETIPIKIAN